MQELTIRIKESSLADFLQALKSFEEVQIKSPKEEIAELIKRIDNGEEKLVPVDWDAYDEVIYASATKHSIPK